MGSNASKVESPATETNTVTIPRTPQDVVDEILDHLATDSDFGSLKTCALVSKTWVPSCRRHIFHTVQFTPRDVDRWFKTFPAPEESPARYVRDLRVCMGTFPYIPEKFFEHIWWFADVERISLLGYEGTPMGYTERLLPQWAPSLWRLPKSVTHLTINTGVLTLLHVRGIMAQLPNLDDLSLILVGPPAPVDRRELLGTGTVLEGRFGGKLSLHGGYVDTDAVDMFLEIPSGLHFTGIRISCSREALPSAVRIAEASSSTLVKLTYTVISPGGRQAFQPPVDFGRSFDLSKFPNLQELNFFFKDGSTMGGTVGGVPWIPMALSTLRPATSPRLSAIRLDLFCESDRPIDTVITDMGNDLRRIAGEVARIEREFEGAVNFAVPRGKGIGTALDRLNILQHHVR